VSPHVDTLLQIGLGQRLSRRKRAETLSEKKGLMCDATTLSGTSPPSGSVRANSSRRSAHPCRLLPDRPYKSILFRLRSLRRLVW
jgi:hypothetical protein